MTGHARHIEFGWKRAGKVRLQVCGWARGEDRGSGELLVKARKGAEHLLTQPSANLPLKRQGSGWEDKENIPLGWEAEDNPSAVDALLLKLLTNRDASYSVALGAEVVSSFMVFASWRPEFVVLISSIM